MADFNFNINSSDYSPSKSPDSFVKNFNLVKVSSFSNEQNYSDMPVNYSNNRIINGDTIQLSEVDALRVQKASDLNLTSREFSDFVELGIEPAVVQKRDNNISRLKSVVPDIDFTLPSSPITSTKLVDVIKEGADVQNDILSETLEAFNHLVTLFQNQNQMVKQSNEIALEANRINEASLLSREGVNKSFVEGIMSISQSLEMLPTLVEATAIGFDNIKSVLNISNEHAYQKNVNDAYAFNYDKDDEKGTKRSLDAISNHLQKSANALHNSEKHHKKQGDYAFEEKKIIDEENSFDYLSILGDIGDAVFDEFADFDIFTYLLENTTEAGGKK